MRGFAAVFSRELAERRLLFLLGITGLVPLLLPLVVPSYLGAGDLRTVSAYFLAGIVAVVLALGLGGSILARDAAERRLGFYFSRPLSGGSIWGGKLAAALALALGIGVLVLLPALLVETGTRAELAAVGAGGALLAVALLAALVLVAHVISTLVRTRSAWLALDLLAAAIVGLVGWIAAERLIRAGLTALLAKPGWLPPLLARPFVGMALVVLAAFLAGSAAQILGGRTDPRRGHRLLSLTFWSLLLAGVLGLEIYSRWLIAATPADLLGNGNGNGYLAVAAAPRGNAVVVQGPAAHREGYWPVFLLDVGSAGSGRFHRIFPAPQWDWAEAVQFSADGHWAVWLEPQSLTTSVQSPVVLVRLDLTRPGARPIQTRLTYPRRPLLLALSPDGRKLATLQSRRLTVEDIDSAHLLTASPVEPAYAWESRFQFVDEAHLLYIHRGGSEGFWPRPQVPTEIAEVDLATGRQEVIGRTPPLEDNGFPEISPDGSRFLLRQSGGRMRVFRTHGAVPLAEVSSFAQVSGFLADGRILLLTPAAKPGDLRELVLLSPDGAVLRRFPFPGARTLRPAGEALPGQLVVGVAMRPTGPSGHGLDHWESRLLDLTTGESRSLGRGLFPLGRLAAGPEGAGPRLFERAEGRVVLLDLATGQERLLTGRPR